MSQPNKIVIELVPHNKQRYETIGDWVFEPNGDISIYVSDMGDWRYHVLVAIHELAEVAMCKHRGISQDSVERFDIAFEKSRAPGNTNEPGDDPKAPYRHEHRIASIIEQILAEELDVDQDKYDQAANAL